MQPHVDSTARTAASSRKSSSVYRPRRANCPAASELQLASAFHGCPCTALRAVAHWPRGGRARNALLDQPGSNRIGGVNHTSCAWRKAFYLELLQQVSK